MKDPAQYGQQWAGVYDRRNPIDDYAQAAAEHLHSLAGKNAALELGVGTGRIAIPLAALGTKVHGVDVSPAMLTHLSERPGGDRVTTSLADMVNDRIPGDFAVVYLAFNTLFMVLEQRQQVQCVRNASTHLRPGGLLVIEAFVPEFQHYTGSQATRTEHLLDDEVWLLTSKHDAVRQVIRTQSIRISADGTELRPVDLRYIWPSELDLMCQLAGLRLRDRFGGWQREPFNSQSTHHVSVYEFESDDACSVAA
ncbi:class I SAM-dependent methyltransferase [Catenulispora pinisilvae]|uniref:class I SAM-dependent methyltransferase n=1 Tax=Catenulispora pinisilvae TaxID=2705253 RepID=UPI0018917D0E|nr:class I SAM-dependent methyltransferase [Catenulispora pinisilvae]